MRLPLAAVPEVVHGAQGVPGGARAVWLMWLVPSGPGSGLGNRGRSRERGGQALSPANQGLPVSARARTRPVSPEPLGVLVLARDDQNPVRRRSSGIRPNLHRRCRIGFPPSPPVAAGKVGCNPVLPIQTENRNVGLLLEVDLGERFSNVLPASEPQRGAGDGDGHDIGKDQECKHEENQAPWTRTLQSERQDSKHDIDNHEQQLDAQPGSA